MMAGQSKPSRPRADRLKAGYDGGDWQRHRFDRVDDAFEPSSQDGSTAPKINRDLVDGAIRDPHQSDRRRIRVRINADVLDRMLSKGRITEGQYHAGRTLQRLLEIGLGSPAFDGHGSRDSSVRDDAIVRSLERAQKVTDEIKKIGRIVGQRSEALLRTLLCERNPNTGRSWTIDDLVMFHGYVTSDHDGRPCAQKHVVYAYSSRVIDSLDDLAQHWDSVSVA